MNAIPASRAAPVQICLGEHRTEFQGTAERRYARIFASGKTVPWKEMRRYLERRLLRAGRRGSLER